jgi:cytochrome oxidase assembly protein ShyY1
MSWGKIGYIVLFWVVFVALVWLGFWQYGRYQQKKQWLTSLASTEHQLPLNKMDLQAKRWQRFRQLELTGSWQNQASFFLSGELRHGRAGYSVVTPLQWAPNEPWVLVDRGWAPATTRSNPPTLQRPLAKDKANGRVYIPAGKRFTLGPWQLPAATGVVVVQDWDFKQIANLLGHPVLPFVLRLSPHLPGRYERQWTWTAAVPPSRHLAYALQWWAFAVVWLAGALVLMNKRHEKKEG